MTKHRSVVQRCEQYLSRSALVRWAVRHCVEIILALVSIVESIAWTFSGGVPFGANSPPIVNATIQTIHYGSVWDWWSNFGAGPPRVVAGELPPMVGMVGFLTLLGTPLLFAVRAYFALLLFLGAVATSYLAKVAISTSQPRAFALIAGLLFLTNLSWIVSGGTDIGGLLLFVSTSAVALAGLVLCVRRASLRWAAIPAAAFGTLFACVPYSIPIIGCISVGVVTGLVARRLLHGRSSRKDLFCLKALVIALAWGAMSVAYVWIALPQAFNYYSFHSTAVANIFPGTGPIFFSESTIYVVTQTKQWTLFLPGLSPSWISLLFSPLGVISILTVPGLAFGSLCVSGRGEKLYPRRLFVTAALIGCLALQMGGTIDPGYWFWAWVIGMPEGANAFAAATSLSLVPFVTIGYSILASFSLLRLYNEAAGRSTPGLIESTKKGGRGPSPFLRRLSNKIDQTIPKRTFRILAQVSILAIAALLIFQAVPLFDGQEGDWTAGLYQGTGTVVPQRYAAVNSWLSAHNHNMSNTFILPELGDWPTFNWPNSSGYQGTNPYPFLLPSVPIIDGSRNPLLSDNLSSAAYLDQAAFSELSTPSALNSTIPPVDPHLSLEGVGPNLATVDEWSTCAQCGNLAWDPSVSFNGSSGALGLQTNNSLMYGNPNGITLRYSLGAEGISLTPILKIWCESPGTTISNSLTFGLGWGGNLADWTTVVPVATAGSWQEYLVSFNRFGSFVLDSATSIIIEFMPTSPVGHSQFFLSSANLASSVLYGQPSDLAVSLYDWQSASLSGDNVSFNTTRRIPNAVGSIQLDAPNADNFGSVNGNGLRFEFDSPQDLASTPVISVWLNISGTATSTVQIGIEYQSKLAYWFAPTFSITVANWTVDSLVLSASSYPEIAEATGILIYFHPQADTGTTRLNVGYLGASSSGRINPGVAKDLFDLLNVQYVVYDSSVIPTYPEGDILGELQNLTFLSIVFSRGGLYLFENNDYIGPLQFTPSLYPEVTADEALTSIVQHPTISSLPVCTSGDCPNPRDRNSNLSLEATPAAYDIGSAQITTSVTGPGVLILPEAFSTGWVATAEGQTLPHIEVDWYANGWVIPNGTFFLTITFVPQGGYSLSLILTLGFDVASVGIFLTATGLGTNRFRFLAEGFASHRRDKLRLLPMPYLGFRQGRPKGVSQPIGIDSALEGSAEKQTTTPGDAPGE